MRRHSQRQMGFGLIEVLISMLVIAIGITAHINFQRVVFRDANNSEARTNSIELAAEKLEDLRSYQRLVTTTGYFAYEDIATNVGGVINQGLITIGNTTYNRGWTVTNWYYNTANTAATQTIPAGAPLPDYKQVTVKIQWVDLTGDAQSLDLTSTIVGLDPSRASRIYQ